jgi:hypothetical protein
MQITRFEGHLEQIDYEDERIRRLHLVSRDGQRLIITIDRAEADTQEAEWELGSRSRPLAFLDRDTRPPVTITESL